jgi:hypothetical protein
MDREDVAASSSIRNLRGGNLAVHGREEPRFSATAQHRFRGRWRACPEAQPEIAGLRRQARQLD